MESVSIRSESSTRRAPRVPAKISLRLLRNGDLPKGGRSAQTVDLSDLGLRIRTTSELSEGETVQIEGWGERGQPMRSRVVWVQRSPDGESFAGIEFMGVAEG